jgi:hypothetical protein
MKWNVTQMVFSNWYCSCGSISKKAIRSITYCEFFMNDKIGILMPTYPYNKV